MPGKPKFDPAVHDENPEWTAEDFATSRPASGMPEGMLAPFKNGWPKTRIPERGSKNPARCRRRRCITRQRQRLANRHQRSAALPIEEWQDRSWKTQGEGKPSRWLD
jgi:hypothetical protein